MKIYLETFSLIVFLMIFINFNIFSIEITHKNRSNRLKSLKIDQNHSKSIKIDQNRFKNGQKRSKRIKNDQIMIKNDQIM